MPQLVVFGATISCAMGAAPVPLAMSQIKSKGNQGISMIATIMDSKPVVNIPTFGNCKYLSAQAKAPTPCVPATTTPWAPGSPTVLVEGKPALTATSKLLCSVTPAGIISITSSGQVTVTVP
jgi:hypothetical protein